MRHPVIPKCPTLLAAALALGLLASCDRRPTPAAHGPRGASHKGVVEEDPPDPGRGAAGQTIYVPAYSSIYISDRAERFDLAITVSIRNTDRARPIVLTSVAYHDQDGRLARDYLRRP